jgi:hypothetical protein
MYQFPSPQQNRQRESNQFLLPTQQQTQRDYLYVRPAINAASNESMQNLSAMFGQQTANQPSRVNDDSLVNSLRKDRPQLTTLRANAHQNPFNIKNEVIQPTNLVYTGGNIDMTSFDDRPPSNNMELRINEGLNSHTLPIFLAGENMTRSKPVPRKSSNYSSIEFPEEMVYDKFRIF